MVCVHTSLRRSYWEEILKSYHDTLSIGLEKLGTNPTYLTYDDLKKEFHKYFKFGLGLALLPAIFSVICDEDTDDLDEMEVKFLVQELKISNL